MHKKKPDSQIFIVCSSLFLKNYMAQNYLSVNEWTKGFQYSRDSRIKVHLMAKTDLVMFEKREWSKKSKEHWIGIVDEVDAVID